MDWIKHRLLLEFIIILSFFFIFIMIIFITIPPEKSNIINIVKEILKEIP